MIDRKEDVDKLVKRTSVDGEFGRQLAVTTCSCGSYIGYEEDGKDVGKDSSSIWL